MAAVSVRERKRKRNTKAAPKLVFSFTRSGVWGTWGQEDLQWEEKGMLVIRVEPCITSRIRHALAGRRYEGNEENEGARNTIRIMY